MTQGYEPPEAKAPDALALTRMWGSSAKVSFIDTTPRDGVTLQLADIRLPEPVAAAIYFEAVREGDPGTVQALTLDLLIGLGRTNVQRSQTFLLQPTFGVPIIFAIPIQPLVSVLATVTARGFTGSANQNVRVDCTLQVAPITRINYQKEALKFGMAVAGEAEGFDDAMHEELEETDPDVAHQIRSMQMNGRHPAEEEFEEADGPGQLVIPVRFEAAIARVAARLGRPPKVGDLPVPLRRRLLRAIGRSP